MPGPSPQEREGQGEGLVGPSRTQHARLTSAHIPLASTEATGPNLPRKGAGKSLYFFPKAGCPTAETLVLQGAGGAWEELTACAAKGNQAAAWDFLGHFHDEVDCP